MQFASIMLATATAVGAVVLPRQNATNQFEVTGLYFGGSPHSTIQFYELDVTDGTYSAHCQTSSSVQPGLLPFGMTPCSDSCWSFAWTYVNRTNPEPGYILDIEQEITPGHNRSGCYFFGASQVQEVVDQLNPNGNYYALSAPSSYNLTYSDGPCIFN